MQKTDPQQNGGNGDKISVNLAKHNLNHEEGQSAHNEYNNYTSANKIHINTS